MGVRGHDNRRFCQWRAWILCERGWPPPLPPPDATGADPTVARKSPPWPLLSSCGGKIQNHKCCSPYLFFLNVNVIVLRCEVSHPYLSYLFRIFFFPFFFLFFFAAVSFPFQYRMQYTTVQWRTVRRHVGEFSFRVLLFYYRYIRYCTGYPVPYRTVVYLFNLWWASSE